MEFQQLSDLLKVRSCMDCCYREPLYIAFHTPVPARPIRTASFNCVNVCVGPKVDLFLPVIFLLLISLSLAHSHLDKDVLIKGITSVSRACGPVSHLSMLLCGENGVSVHVTAQQRPAPSLLLN